MLTKSVEHITVITHLGPDITGKGEHSFPELVVKDKRGTINRALILQLYYITIY